MDTTRFETFLDAIIAIIMTVLVLKISQPAEPTLAAIWDLRISYLAYLISFLTLFNIWYNNHNLFQKVENIDNTAVWIFGIMTFVISLVPYFTIWVALHVDSIPAETMYGLLFVITNILYVLSVKAIYNSNQYNKELQETNSKVYYQITPLFIILAGFILTCTIYRPGIYISCLISIILWILIGWRSGNE